MKKKRLSVLLCACMLAACTPFHMRTVDVLNPERFAAMSRDLRAVMLKKGVLDKNGEWYSPLTSPPTEHAGQILLDRLSPVCCFSGNTAGDSSRSMLAEDARVIMEKHRVVIVQSSGATEMELVARTDWDGDGAQDWLVRCEARFTDEPDTRLEYYLLIKDLKASVFTPQILALWEHRAGRRKILYDALESGLSDAFFMELPQGQTVITEKPGMLPAKQGGEDSGITVRALSR